MEQIELLFRRSRFEEGPEIAHVVPLLRRQSHLDRVRLVVGLLAHIRVRVLKCCAVQVCIMLPIYGLGLHLVINGHIAPNRLLIIVKLHLNLIRRQEFSSFSRVRVIKLVLVFAEEVLD